MTRNEVKALARSDPAGALEAAELFGYEELAAAIRQPPAVTAFTHLGRARFSLSDTARAAGMPISSVQAAVAGRIEGRMSHKQRRLLSGYLWDRYEALCNALVELDPDGSREVGLL